MYRFERPITSYAMAGEYSGMMQVFATRYASSARARSIQWSMADMYDALGTPAAPIRPRPPLILRR